MVKAGVAKVVNDQDDAWEICVVGEKSLLDKVVYMEFEGEDWQYMDFDNNEIVLHPGEKLEWFIKKDIA